MNCNKTDLINVGITNLNATLSILGSLSNGSNCFNYVNSLIGLLYNQNQTDISLINDLFSQSNSCKVKLKSNLNEDIFY